MDVRDDRGRALAGVVVEVRADAEPPLDLLLAQGLRAWDGWNYVRDLPERVWAERKLITDGAMVTGADAFPYLPEGFLNGSGNEVPEYSKRWARANAKSFAPPEWTA